MDYKKTIPPFLMLFALIQFGFSQENNQTFIAQKGDGIVSILWREGLEVDLYYQEFLKLNRGLIVDGSYLERGKTYKIPNSDTSFRNMGRKINLNSQEEHPIFENTKIALKKKDTLLKNAVYYLLVDHFNSENLQPDTVNSKRNYELATAMAAKLLEHGARVFLFENSQNDTTALGDYVAAINNRYLKHQEDYQRLLVVDVGNGNLSTSSLIYVDHDQKSKEGEHFAKSITKTFKARKFRVPTSKNEVAFLSDKTNFYLLSNVLPALTFVRVDNQNKKTQSNTAAVTNKSTFVNVITTGIQIDYSTIVMGEK
jgi:N-acetylmuramoyl-L-alanine amidase